MRLAGCLLLLSGFLVVVAALVLLPAIGMRLAFVAAGLCVEALGVWMMTQAYRAIAKEQRLAQR